MLISERCTRPGVLVRGLIAPHAGLLYSGPVAAHAYAPLRHCRYSAIIIVGPSHFVGFHGVSIWPRGAWESPLGDVKIAESGSRHCDAVEAGH